MQLYNETCATEVKAPLYKMQMERIETIFQALTVWEPASISSRF